MQEVDDRCYYRITGVRSLHGEVLKFIKVSIRPLVTLYLASTAVVLVLVVVVVVVIYFEWAGSISCFLKPI